MQKQFKELLWSQFGAAIEMLDNAIVACPDDLWSGRGKEPESWYVAYHAIFWLDLYESGAVEGFAPPKPFGLEELDPACLLPDQPYTKEELRDYLAFARSKWQATIAYLTDEKAQRRCVFGWGEVVFTELILYTMRHVQHHTGQLNLMLRQSVDAAPRWVAKAKTPL